MFAFLLWCILFVLCWPLALLALVAYPYLLAAPTPVPYPRRRRSRCSGDYLPGHHAALPTAGGAVSYLSRVIFEIQDLKS